MPRNVKKAVAFGAGSKSLAVPEDCKIEVLRMLGLLPVACMNFRWDMD